MTAGPTTRISTPSASEGRTVEITSNGMPHAPQAPAPQVPVQRAPVQPPPQQGPPQQGPAQPPVYGAPRPPVYGAPPPPVFGAPQPPVFGPPQPTPPPTPQPFPPQFGAGFPAPAGLNLPLVPPRRRNTGKIVGLVAAVLTVLVGLGIGGLLLFGTHTVDPQSVQQEIVRITQAAVGVAPTDVRCPTDIKAEAGGTFTCTGTVDGQPVTYDVKQDDAKGHLTITYDRLLKMADIESKLAEKVGRDVAVTVNVTCDPAGRTVVVEHPGLSLSCTVTNATNPTDSARIKVTVSDDGTPSYSFV